MSWRHGVTFLVGRCPRPCHPPATLVAARPAALASASELLRSDNPAWADKALTHAKQVRR